MSATHYERLSTQDSSFIIFEGPGTHMHVSALGLFDLGPLATPGGGIDIDRLRRYVDSRLHLLPRYRMRLEFTPIQRHPIWVDDPHFRLDYHVRHTSLPDPGNEEQLRELVGRILSQQLDREKPLWEMWLIEGLEGGRFAMLSKVHHCMVDGASGVGVMTSLLSPSPDERIEPGPRWKPRSSPGPLRLARDEIAHRMGTPVSALSALRDAVLQPARASARVADGADAMWQALNAGFRLPANTPLNQPIGTHRRIDWCALELSEIKDVKKRLGGTVNDVVLSVVSGAMRRFLTQRRAALDDLDFRIVIPVSLRTGPADPSTGNRVSAWFLTLPLEEPDPLRRFARIQGETARLKDSKAAQGIELFTRMTEWTGSDLLTFWGVRLASTLRPYNMIVTNVPGPQFPLYLLGARLDALYPQPPLFENQGLGVAVMSYLGRVFFGLVGDWDLVPDLAAFARAIDRSFGELRKAAQNQGS